MQTFSRTRIALTVAVLLLALSAPAARADDDLQEIVRDARETIDHFNSDPNMDWFQENAREAKGLLVIPRLWRGGFFFGGGSGGSGVLLARDQQADTWSYPAFYTIGSVNFGPQIGVEWAEVVLVVMTQKGLDTLLATSVKLGADLQVAAGPVGTGTKVSTADIFAYSRAKGAYAGVTLEGAVVAARDSWNEAYYGKPVRPLDILVKRDVRNSNADPLREEIARVTGGRSTRSTAAVPRGKATY